LVLLLVAAAPAHAHHSFAPYEPDVQFQLDVVDEKGEKKHWLIECANPGILNRIGWKWNMVKVGDEISAIVSPLRNGEPGALLKAIRLPDGTTHGNGGPAGPARIDFKPAKDTP
jgi:hypothetical protein